MRALKSLLFWCYLGSTSAALFFVALVIWALTVPFDRRRRLLHRFTCWWGYHYVQLNPFWHPTIVGREKIEDGARYVIVANHLSMGDILLLFGLKKHFKWVSKASVFKVPFIGWNMALNDYVSLVRGDRRSIVEMYKACRRHLEQGSSVLLFPEGTRSRDGRLQAFKVGAFSLAVQQGVPVVPVVIRGSFEALPKASWVFPHDRALELTVTVLDPVDPAAFAGSAERLSSEVHRLMNSHLEYADEHAPGGGRSA